MLFKKHPTVLIIILYTVLTVIFTYPLLFNLTSQIPKGEGDMYQAIAQIESRTEVLEQKGVIGGLYALAADQNLNTFLPYVLFNLVFNTFTSYNILFLLSFILSGLGAYLLCFYFTKNKTASFLAGMLFAFSPFHVYQSTIAHAGTMHQEWIPFFILFLFKFFEEFKFKYFALSVVFLSLIALTEHHLLAFTVLFLGIFLAYKLITQLRVLGNKKFWMYAVFSAMIMVIVSFSLFSSMFRIASSENNFLDPGIKSARKYAMKPLDPLAPPKAHSLWPEVNLGINTFLLGERKEDRPYFIGYLTFGVILFMLAALIYRKKWKIITKDNAGISLLQGLLFWVITTVLFYIFALGPQIKTGDQKIFMPYYLIYEYLPFYENIRTTGRLFVYAMLGVSLLFAYGMVLLINRYPYKRNVLAGIFAVVILLEFSAVPLPTISITHSPFYYKIAKDKEQYKIMEIPGSTDYDFASYAMITETIHKKQPMHGMPLARVIKGQFDFQKKTPVIKQLLYTLPTGHNPEKNKTPDYFKNANEILHSQNIRYITISKKFLKEIRVERTMSFIEKYIKYEEKYEDEYLVAYRVRF